LKAFIGLNDFLGKAAAVARDRFGGKITTVIDQSVN
jgi:hypothetical protein